MEQYVSKSALVAEIKKRGYYAQIMSDSAINGSMRQFYDGMKQGCVDILSTLDTLEVKEVDLEKEYERYYEQERNIQTFKLAKYFFELGLKAQSDKEQEESVPQHSYSETIYHVGKEPRWKINDNLAYYQFYSDYEGEYNFGKVTNIEFNKEYEDWYYTFEDGDIYSEEELIREETYRIK